MLRELRIIFSTDMVRALLEGRKSQTRRLSGLDEINENPDGWLLLDVGLITVSGDGKTIVRFGALFQDKTDPTNVVLVPSPYGQPGDVLYVRETWKPNSWDENTGWISVTFKDGARSRNFEIDDPDMFERLWISISDEFDRKGMEPVDIIGDEEYGVYSAEQVAKLSWRPSIHMPKAAARIWLQVESVGVERVQDISEEDAKAEGVQENLCDNPSGCHSSGTHRQQGVCCGAGEYFNYMDETQEGYPCASAVESYQSLWTSINGPRSWESNPWVWKIVFHRIENKMKPKMFYSRHTL